MLVSDCHWTFLDHIINAPNYAPGRHFTFSESHERFHLLAKAIISLKNWGLASEIFDVPPECVSKKNRCLVVKVVSCCQHVIALALRNIIKNVSLREPARGARASTADARCSWDIKSVFVADIDFQQFQAAFLGKSTGDCTTFGAVVTNAETDV